MLVNKLATVSLIRMSKQYSCQVRDADSKTEDLIQVLSLQMITQSKTRLTADNLKSYRETNDLDSRKTVDLNERIMSSSISASFETEFLSLFIKSSSNIDVRKKKSSILSLIKNVQEFDLLCR